MIQEMIEITGTINVVDEITGGITLPEIVRPPAYHGQYTVTPTAETQVLEAKGKYMTDDVTINPIPSNYGLITWDGSTITVS